MLDKRIDKLKKQLNQMVLTEEFNSKRLLQKSQALDRLIVEVMISRAENPHSSNAALSSQHFINGSIKGNSATGLHQDDMIKEKATSGHQHDDIIKKAAATVLQHDDTITGDVVLKPIWAV